MQSSSDQKNLSIAALQAFFNLSHHWKLSPEQEYILLGSPKKDDFISWKKDLIPNTLEDDILKRISYLIGIHKSLHILLANNHSKSDWLRKPNKSPVLKGVSALDKILSGNIEDLAIIHRYLVAERNS